MSEYLDVKAALSFLKISRPTLYRLIARGVITKYVIPGFRGPRFKREDLENLPRPQSEPPKD